MGSQGTKLALIESRDQVYDYDHDILPPRISNLQ